MVLHSLDGLKTISVTAKQVHAPVKNWVGSGNIFLSLYLKNVEVEGTVPACEAKNLGKLRLSLFLLFFTQKN